MAWTKLAWFHSYEGKRRVKIKKYVQIIDKNIFYEILQFEIKKDHTLEFKALAEYGFILFVNILFKL